MNILPINNLSFTGKIIDSHTHLGQWGNQWYDANSIDKFIKQPLKNGDVVEKIIVSTLSCMGSNEINNEISGNKELLEIINNNPKYIPLAVCQPKTGSAENIKRLFKENSNKFYGLKFHLDNQEVFASDRRLIPYLKFAAKSKLPCLFHCGIVWENDKLVPKERRYSSPEEIYKAAKIIPDSPVILAHLGSGGDIVHQEAVNVLLESIKNNDATLYTDISWVDINDPQKPNLVKLINAMKNTSQGDRTDRILFGSDIPIGEYTSSDGLSGKALYEKVIADTKQAITDNFDDAPELIDKIFYKNAENLFFNKRNTEKKSSAQRVKIITALCGTAAVSYITLKKFFSSAKKSE